MKNKVIIDTDCGLDDIIAISLLLSYRNIDVAGISTVFGLVKPELGVQNLARLLEYFEKNIDLCIGSDKALRTSSWDDTFPKQDVTNATQLHFLRQIIKKGLQKPITSEPVEEWIYKRVDKYPKQITILCLGPLTNIARTLMKYGKNFEKKIDRLVVMGGAVFVPGNVAPIFSSEYNVFLDPKAASIIFKSKIPIYLVSLDGARQVPVKNQFIDEISNASPGNKFGQIIKKIILSNKNDFKYFYDPLAASVLISRIATFSDAQSLDVIQSGRNKGQTVLSDRENKNIKIISRIKPKLFYSLVKKTITFRSKGGETYE